MPTSAETTFRKAPKTEPTTVERRAAGTEPRLRFTRRPVSKKPTAAIDIVTIKAKITNAPSP